MSRKLPKKFHVVFSFAGEQRRLVTQIAEALESRLGKNTVFLDEWFEYLIAGHDGDLVLQDIYANRAWMIIICVSGRYGSKPWTAIEHEAIRALYMQLRCSTNPVDRLRVLPLRVGDGDVPGIPITTISPDARHKSVEETTQLIVNRLAEITPRTAMISDVADVPPAALIAEIRDDTGPMSASNPWYIERKVDTLLLNFLTRGGRTAALLGAPQMGKSSLAIRVEKRLREFGYRVVGVNLRDDIAAEDFVDPGCFFTTLTKLITRQLHLTQTTAAEFNRQSAPSDLAAFLVCQVLPVVGEKVLLVFDHFDHLFQKPCDVQALSALRALHNKTADPPLDHLRMILIHTLRSPPLPGPLGSVLDVARKFDVKDFTLEEVQYLNSVHRNLLPPEKVVTIYELLGGHPALTRQAWTTMAGDGLTADQLLIDARRDGGPFEPHLRSLLKKLQQPEQQIQRMALRDLIDGKGCRSEEVFEQLLLMGVVSGTFHGDAIIRCGLYRSWLPRRLPK